MLLFCRVCFVVFSSVIVHHVHLFLLPWLANAFPSFFKFISLVHVSESVYALLRCEICLQLKCSIFIHSSVILSKWGRAHCNIQSFLQFPSFIRLNTRPNRCADYTKVKFVIISVLHLLVNLLWSVQGAV